MKDKPFTNVFWGILIIAGIINIITGEIAKGVISSGYDRKQEEEADLTACEILERAGIEPYILASFFRKLKDVSGQEFFSEFEIISSHPNLDRRIRNVLSFKISGDFTLRGEQPNLSDLKKMIQD